MFEFEDGWIIRDRSFSYDTEIRKGSAYAMANGYMGNRGALEEIDSEIARAHASSLDDHGNRGGDPLRPKRGRFVGTYLAGIYDAHKGVLREREIVNIQNWASIRLWVDGELFDLSSGEVVQFKRWMNLRDAVLHRESKWKSRAGKVVTLKTERLVSMADIHCGLIWWRLTTEDDCQVVIQSGIDADVINTQKDHFKDFMSSHYEEYIYLEAITKEMSYHVGVACHDIVRTSPGIRVEKATVRNDKKYIFNQYRAGLPKGSTISLIKTAAIYTSRDVGESVQKACLEELNRITALGHEKTRARHMARWSELWHKTDMVIEGDDEVQIGMRFVIYHLLNSAPYHTNDVSYTARSLSGQDHWGTIHWDTEIFIVPFFTYRLPEVAKNMLIYRYKGLSAARDKAKELGLRGAYYAWRSHEETGVERCPWRVNKNVKTGRYMRNYFRDKQIHISADIAYCVWQYYEVTGDIDFLVRYGARMVLEIARFHESRVSYNRVKQNYMIKDVMGPDEYHARVHDNAFTNAMVKESFAIAFRVLDLVQGMEPESYTRLLAEINLDESELARWHDMHNKLFVPIPDKGTRLIEQFRNYFRAEDCSVEQVRSRKSLPDEFLGDIVAKTQVIKQADVVMLLYLLRDRYSDEVKRKNWEYYEPRTEHGSSLSPMAYGLMAADVGMLDQAYEYFKHSALMDIASDDKYFSGYYNHGVHPCSLGGAWLTVVNGFSGITLKEDGVYWRKPYMPIVWKRLAFTLRWHGHDIRFTYENENFVALLESDDEEVEIPFFLGKHEEILRVSTKVAVRCGGQCGRV